MSAAKSKKPEPKAATPKIQQINLVPLDQQKGKLKLLGGSNSDEFNNYLADQAIKAMWLPDYQTEDMLARAHQSASVFMMGLKPRDEIEGALAVQMWATHCGAMEAHRRAMLPEQNFQSRVANLRAADRCSRTFAALTDALNKHRGNGGQKVTVEHVHVHEGGQAIVGNVQGGGVTAKKEEQPHANQDADAPNPALPSPDPARDGVPISGSEWQTPVPHARRRTRQRRT